ncbi:MAG: DUF1549 domain-containing protein [Actinomycetota bacterium]
MKLAPLLFTFALCAAPAVAAPTGSGAPVLLPSSVTLDGPRAFQRLLVEAKDGRGYRGDLTAKARFVSSNPKVATVDAGGTVRPVADGMATVTALIDGRKVFAGVRVRNSRKPFRWSFANHVQPVLTKTGCNSGACHGASAGKGGLKLTLRGYDAPADHAVLTRQALGRRVVPAEPALSLLVQKPVMGIPHGGGQRFKQDSPEYRVLLEWIAAGSPAPSPSDTRMTGLEVFPAEAILKPGMEQQILVRASFADGRTEDVTRWVKYGASDDAVAGVDDGGLVTVKGSGEAAITIWYLNQVAFARIASPFPGKVTPQVYAKAERRNFIDQLVLKKLQALGLPPSPLASDARFIRRAYLDAAGVIPTPEEVEKFLADPAPDKRAKLVDRLLARPEFADYWAYKWSDLLLVSSRKLPSKGMWSFYYWIRRSVAENKPWDRFAREIITATGSTQENGATNYYVLHKDPIDLTETTSQAFLGMSITCARCHNHPLEKWTQNDYYGMANLFARVRLKNGESAGETLVYPAESGDVNHPRSGVPMPPKPLDAAAMSVDATDDRRERLAEWLTSAENPYFSRAIVNRVWRNFMGRGLVEAEDDLRLTNPPSNEELLTAVARDFTQSGFDIKHLIRAIMNSATYQRSSSPVPGNEVDQRFYSRYIPRRLPSEVILDAISQVTGAPTDFSGYPKGTRALQLPDTQVGSYFLTAFGRPQRVQTCSCEREEEPNVAQALHLSNGDTINNKLRAKEGTVSALVKEGLSDEQTVERVYLLALSRRPTLGERNRVLAALRRYPVGAADRREAVEDLLSAVLTTKEFLFNH